MEIKEQIKIFKEKGYIKIPIENIKLVEETKLFISYFISDKYKIKGSADYILNNCHKYIDNIDDSKVNQFILEIIREFSKNYKMDEIIYQSSKLILKELLGPDIASQRNPNIVFQFPNSERVSELHSDAPANSFFEVVTWLPLVDCYESKSFYILNKSDTFDMLHKYKKNEFDSYSNFRSESIKKAEHLKINYGEILIFWSGILHGSLKNTTSESRWSYNVRYKNLFAPPGLKDPLNFYNIFLKSPITEIASKLL